MFINAIVRNNSRVSARLTHKAEIQSLLGPLSQEFRLLMDQLWKCLV